MTTEAKHTPGPWLDGGPSPYGGRRIVDGDDVALALTTSFATAEDDRLILAAPDLLAALQRIERATMYLTKITGVPRFEEVESALDAARAAIAKAEGR